MTIDEIYEEETAEEEEKDDLSEIDAGLVEALYDKNDPDGEARFGLND